MKKRCHEHSRRDKNRGSDQRPRREPADAADAVPARAAAAELGPEANEEAGDGGRSHGTHRSGIERIRERRREDRSTDAEAGEQADPPGKVAFFRCDDAPDNAAGAHTLAELGFSFDIRRAEPASASLVLDGRRIPFGELE